MVHLRLERVPACKDNASARSFAKTLASAQAQIILRLGNKTPRYSGSSLGYQLASVIAGGPAPLMATALFASYHTGYAIAIYLAICAVISYVSTAYMPDYTGKDVAAEYDR